MINTPIPILIPTGRADIDDILKKRASKTKDESLEHYSAKVYLANYLHENDVIVKFKDKIITIPKCIPAYEVPYGGVVPDLIAGKFIIEITKTNPVSVQKAAFYRMTNENWFEFTTQEVFRFIHERDHLVPLSGEFKPEPEIVYKSILYLYFSEIASSPKYRKIPYHLSGIPKYKSNSYRQYNQKENESIWIGDCIGGYAICPCCKEKLVYHKPIDKIDYFRHTNKVYSDSNYKPSKELQEKLEAQDWLCENKPNLFISCAAFCKIDNATFTGKGIWRKNVKWKEFIVDVVTDDGLFIDVVHNQNCNPEKIKAYNDSNQRWIQVYAKEPGRVLNNKPYPWNVKQCCKEKPFRDLLIKENGIRRYIDSINENFFNNLDNKRSVLHKKEPFGEIQNGIKEEYYMRQSAQNEAKKEFYIEQLVKDIQIEENRIREYIDSTNDNFFNNLDNKCYVLLKKENIKQDLRRWKSIQSFINAPLDSENSSRIRLIDYANLNSLAFYFVVDFMGEKSKNPLVFSEQSNKDVWYKRLANRKLDYDQRMVIEYLKWESDDFCNLRKQGKI